MKVKITVQEFDDIIKKINNQYRLIAPVAKPYLGQYSDTEVIRYEEVKSIKDIEFRKKSLVESNLYQGFFY